MIPLTCGIEETAQVNLSREEKENQRHRIGFVKGKDGGKGKDLGVFDYQL